MKILLMVVALMLVACGPTPESRPQSTPGIRIQGQFSFIEVQEFTLSDGTRCAGGFNTGHGVALTCNWKNHD